MIVIPTITQSILIIGPVLLFRVCALVASGDLAGAVVDGTGVGNMVDVVVSVCVDRGASEFDVGIEADSAVEVPSSTLVGKEDVASGTVEVRLGRMLSEESEDTDVDIDLVVDVDEEDDLLVSIVEVNAESVLDIDPESESVVVDPSEEKGIVDISMVNLEIETKEDDVAERKGVTVAEPRMIVCVVEVS